VTGVGAPVHGASRLLRAAALGLTCLALGMGGHILAGGQPPSLTAALLLTVPLGCLSLLLTARRCGLATIGACMAGSQIVLHEALMWSAASRLCRVGSGTTTSATLVHLGHSGAGQLNLHCDGAMTSMASTSMSGHSAALMPGLTLVMLAGHAVAALGATLVLAYGERLAWRLAAWLGRVTDVVRPAQLPVAARRNALSASPVHRLQVLARAGSMTRRGPPAALASS
jgi:hypothetical protein